jgi:DNA-binding transcriptional ArsR family regulator
VSRVRYQNIDKGVDMRYGGDVDTARVFAALANHDRLAIIEDLRKGSASASIGEISSGVELNRFTTSRHLAILRDAGLVVARRHGQRIVHDLVPAAFDAIDDWLLPHLESSSDVHPLDARF